MIKHTVEVEYALYLPLLDEWIVETSDDRIWLKGDRSKRFTDTSFDAINRLMFTIANEKFLIPNITIQVVTIIDEHSEVVL